jgi:predicted nucleic acid-binding protein
MIVADTTVWIDYVNGTDNSQTQWLKRLIANGDILVGDLIIAEFLQGFKTDSDFSDAKKLINSFRYHGIVGKKIAIKSAENYRLLRKRGITIRKTIDVIIGTFCIENNLSLLHNDRDFDPMEEHLGLKVIRSVNSI